MNKVRRAVVLILLRDRKLGQILLISKKRGLGAGRLNFPGGKVDAGESLKQAAIRECIEETGLCPLDVVPAGRIVYDFEGAKAHYSNECFVFTAERFEGLLQETSAECDAFWHSDTDLPFDRFWPDDRIWVPRVLAGEHIDYEFLFSEDEQMLSERKNA
jgi:8-oxo-dGTP diphosphatase